MTVRLVLDTSFRCRKLLNPGNAKSSQKHEQRIDIECLGDKVEHANARSLLLKSQNYVISPI
jgi:hypothetical protein